MKKGDTSPFSILIGGAIAVVILIVVVLLVMKGAKTGDTALSCEIVAGQSCSAQQCNQYTDGNTYKEIPNICKTVGEHCCKKIEV